MTKADDRKGAGVNDPALQDPAHARNLQGKDRNRLRAEADRERATRFDGNPNPEPAPDGVLGPKDDTPWRLKKKE